MTKPPGVLIVLTGPSGVGKGVLRKQIAEEMPWLKESVSVTTRQKRAGEVEGVDYFFASKATFDTMIAENQLIEWAEFAGNYYGTPKQFVEQTLVQGFSLLLEIEVQGALAIKTLFPEAHLIFIAPPSLQELEARLRNRDTDTNEDIQRRLQAAADELAQQSLFDTVIINDNLEHCTKALVSLIQKIVSSEKEVSCS